MILSISRPRYVRKSPGIREEVVTDKLQVKGEGQLFGQSGWSEPVDHPTITKDLQQNLPSRSFPLRVLISARMLLLGESQRHAIIICTDVNGCRESYLCLQTNHHMAASVDSRAPPVQVSFSVGLHDGPLESDLDHPIDKLHSTFFARHGRRKNESLSSSTLPFRPTLVLGSATARKS